MTVTVIRCACRKREGSVMSDSQRLRNGAGASGASASSPPPLLMFFLLFRCSCCCTERPSPAPPPPVWHVGRTAAAAVGGNTELPRPAVGAACAGTSDAYPTVRGRGPLLPKPGAPTRRTHPRHPPAVSPPPPTPSRPARRPTPRPPPPYKVAVEKVSVAPRPHRRDKCVTVPHHPQQPHRRPPADHPPRQVADQQVPAAVAGRPRRRRRRR